MTEKYIPEAMFPEGSPAEQYYRIEQGTHVALEATVVEVIEPGRLRVSIEGAHVEVTEYQKIQPRDEGEWVVYVP